MRHPYTQGLFSSIPLPGADKNARPLVPIRGQLPLPHERPEGCNFGPRCDHFRARRVRPRPDRDGGGAASQPGHASPLPAVSRRSTGSCRPTWPVEAAKAAAELGPGGAAGSTT